ncbi:helix-turn-helix domain-containing protein [uncultured Oscillibacter sp.]|uniref:helix-turn-helix domain-containing protein n=1 Tax=uncultured Oscillibacter sp. TaxID=876091 RepID=UPI0025E729D1|nr:helix-turn-helix domain-containing protein [uncultured Oscillibacter sp.]
MKGLEYALQIEGISQSEIAERLGIKKQNLTLWLRGKQAISKKHIPELEKALGISADLLQKELTDEDKLNIQNSFLLNQVTGDVVVESLEFSDGDGEPIIGLTPKDFDTDSRFYEIFRNSMMIEFISTWKSVKENYELLCKTDTPASEQFNKLLQSFVSVFTETHNITMSVFQEDDIDTTKLIDAVNNFAKQYSNLKLSNND